jgi:tyrosinase
MAVLRGNILTSAHAQTFLTGAVRLSGMSTGVTPTQLNQSVPRSAPAARLFGTTAEMARPLSWWDLFTWWHVTAMSWPTGGGNRAHRGPVFLPWHRLYLRRLEEAIQAVTGDDDFALPYWNWSADGALPAAQQRTAPIWSLLGPSQGQVTQGPLAQFRVRLTQSVDDGRFYVGPPRPIWRDAGRGRPTLPDPADESATLADGSFDAPTWDEASDGFRNKLEGFQDPGGSPVPRPGPFMHNRVHVWTGGDMAPGSSPNDPIFFLNHCNVDRLWEAWLTQRGRTYLPSGQGPVGHRANDPLFSVVWSSMTPTQVLDPTEAGLDWYRYDMLPGAA